MKKTFKYVYGPVESWRMGKSLGIDPLSDTSKICNLNCIYCQLGKTAILSKERKVYVPTEEIMNEIKSFPKVRNIDFYTISGRGEPTLASNLGELIKALKKTKRREVAVITNSTLLYLPEVRMDLMLADYVIAKLDACDELSFLDVDKAMKGTSFEKTLKGLKKFKEQFQGRLAIQIMFIKENQKYARAIAEIVREINPDEIHINTPLRPSSAHPLNNEEIKQIKSFFTGMPAVSVYDQPRKETIPVNTQDTIKRHGNYKNLKTESIKQCR